MLPTWDPAKRRRWIYRQVEHHGMPAIRLGRQLVFDTAAVARWLADHSTAPEMREPDLSRAQGSRDEQTDGQYQPV